MAGSFRETVSQLILFGMSLASPVLAQTSPMDFHREIRQEVLQGADVTQRVKTFTERTGDHSFEAFLRPSQTLVAALRVQALAFEHWSAQEYEAALAHFQKALDLFRYPSAASEAAFCLYYMAEVLTEQERLAESLAWLGKALQRSGASSRAYLEGVIFQSKGYCLWYLDDLPAGIRAFGQASERWEAIGFAPGMISCWNNLAVLYEELRLWSRAEDAYKQALRGAGADLDPEIRFYLHANYALFLKERNRKQEARVHLDLARELRSVSPQEFQLLKWKLDPRGEETIDRLLHFQPSLPSLQIERALFLAELYEQQGNRKESRRYLETALRKSEPASMRYYGRKAALALGKWLEQEGLHQDAAALYFKTLQQEQHLSHPELVFPYSRLASPLLTAWVRCLARLGRTEEAWRQIQRFVYLRKVKAESVFARGLSVTEHLGESHPLLLARRLEDPGFHPEIPVDLDFDLSTDLTASIDENATLIEMWPDQASVHTWIISSSGWRYRKLTLPREPAQLIEEVVGPLYSAQRTLPPTPSARLLQLLYGCLFRPLQSLLQSRNVLLVAHGELQSLPFEMLQDETGSYLLQEYNFSYLPASYWLLRKNSDQHSRAPALVIPSPELAEVYREELQLRSLFPEVEVLQSLQGEALAGRPWIHISTHFRLENPWPVSGFADAGGELNLLQFLQKRLSCRLLSLGVCDAGNSYSSASPYWLGFSELFLTRGAETVIVNRWRLDELSSRIYRDFYSLCKEGWAMDAALTRARRSFLETDLVRGRSRVPGDHPFFWGGITYVGLPGAVLYPAGSKAGAVLWALSLALVVCSVLILIGRRRSEKKQ